jgi:hypothetical protein
MPIMFFTSKPNITKQIKNKTLICHFEVMADKRIVFGRKWLRIMIARPW